MIWKATLTTEPTEPRKRRRAHSDPLYNIIPYIVFGFVVMDRVSFFPRFFLWHEPGDQALF